jgi:hypothetical protein
MKEWASFDHLEGATSTEDAEEVPASVEAAEGQAEVASADEPEAAEAEEAVPTPSAAGDNAPEEPNPHSGPGRWPGLGVGPAQQWDHALMGGSPCSER